MKFASIIYHLVMSLIVLPLAVIVILAFFLRGSAAEGLPGWMLPAIVLGCCALYWIVRGIARRISR